MGESDAALLLTRRLEVAPAEGAAGALPSLRLALSADERTRLRGHRRSLCGRDLLLQLERGSPLRPGEWLVGAIGEPAVCVEAAPEPLLAVRSSDPLALLQAAYHLGNRHVALEIGPSELRLLWDPVLAHLLEHRGLQLLRIEASFLPEAGAYGAGNEHAHSHSHSHSHSHGHSQAPAHNSDPASAALP